MTTKKKAPKKKTTMSAQRKRKAKPFYDADEYTKSGIKSTKPKVKNAALKHLGATRELDRAYAKKGPNMTAAEKKAGNKLVSKYWSTRGNLTTAKKKAKTKAKKKK